MKLIEWINGITKLNKKTMDEFQNNISEAIQEASESGGDGILTGSVIGYNGEEIPEGYEEVGIEYSTEETLTGRKWINGKPTYSKTIDFGLLTDADTLSSYTTGTDVEYVIDYNAKLINASNCTILPTKSGNVTGEINVYSVKPYIVIELERTLATAWTDRSLVVTVEYTKTTD